MVAPASILGLEAVGGEAEARPALWVGEAADVVTAADFDADGSIECVVGQHSSRVLEIYGGNGPQALRLSSVELAAPPAALASGDFDGDGSPELVAGLVDGRVAVYVSGPGLAFTLAGTVTLPRSPTDVDVATSVSGSIVVAATPVGVHTVPAAPEPAGVPVTSAVRDAVDRLAAFAGQASADATLAGAGLTRREAEVVGLAMKGLSARDIGKRLFIGDRTVETHLRRAYHKLGVRSRFELLLKTALSGSAN